MKPVIFSFVFLYLIGCLPLYAQDNNEIGVGISADFPTQISSNIDVSNELGALLYYRHSFTLSNHLYLEPEIELHGIQYYMDAIFMKENDVYDFKNTPEGYKQARLSIYSLRIPLLLKYGFLIDNKNKSLLFIGAGPYFETLLFTQEKYKYKNEITRQKAEIQNPFQVGINIDLGVNKFLYKSFSLHIGCQYQLTSYLNKEPSFKPFVYYIKTGFNF